MFGRGEMSDGLGAQYLDDALRQFHSLKALAEGALAQIEEHDLFTTLDVEANSIAVLVKHVAGSMRAPWAALPACAEDDQDRDRDSEFIVAEEETKAVLIERWEVGWRYLFSALEPLTPEHLPQTVHIRGKPLSVL